MLAAILRSGRSPSQQHAFGFQVWQALQQQALADLAGEIAALEDGSNGTATQFVDLLRDSAELATFADGDYQGGGLQRFRANAFYNQFHVWVLE